MRNHKKCIEFANHQTRWEGLWYNAEWHNYASKAFNLKALKDFKGTCRIRMIKNRFHKKDDGRPEYLFTVSATNLDPEEVNDWEVEEVEVKEYSYSEVYSMLRECINRCFDLYEYGERDPYNVIPEDFLN